MSYKDYYAVLGVARTATSQELARAYRQLARRYHPDVSKEPDAEARFLEIQEAYDVLKDDDKRRLYDKYGPQWKAISEGRQPGPGPAAGEVGFDFGPFGFGGFGNTDDMRSIFEQVFAQRRAGPKRRARASARSEPEAVQLELSVLEAFQGGPKEIVVRGASGERRLTVQIPKGVRPGQRIRLAGASGELQLVVSLRTDERFRLDGDDVHTTLRISPSEAVLGATAPLVTLEGTVKVKVPPGSSTGRQVRLRERGYPKRDGGRGDLYAELQIVVPTDPTPEERALYERLAEASRFDPRS